MGSAQKTDANDSKPPRETSLWSPTPRETDMPSNTSYQHLSVRYSARFLTMKLRRAHHAAFLLLSCVAGVSGQSYYQDDNYQDYEGDNLYADYANKQAAG